jgi:UDP-N-acetylmuramyl pentapeptide phosphotransferase/UDP-N-acetylglucosamine-1-phosphate transferase
MEFIIVTFILLVLELLYFRIADKFNIIDKPNHRSSHTQITLRGGGIIFPIAFVLYFVVSAAYRKDYFLPEDYWSFGLGLLALSTISFLDDILDYRAN